LTEVCDNPQKKEEKAIKEKYDQKRKELHEKVYILIFSKILRFLNKKLSIRNIMKRKKKRKNPRKKNSSIKKCEIFLINQKINSNFCHIEISEFENYLLILYLYNSFYSRHTKK